MYQLHIYLIVSIVTLLNQLDCRIIKTSKGELNGDEIGTFHMFKKIPFAKPPIGKLRFQRPQPADKWNGVWDATEYGAACMSNSSHTKSPQKWIDEDCLHLNIFTNEHCLKSKDCSVSVYLHGGALNYDSAVMFNDSYLLDVFVQKDIVLVIPGFRLGIFSHFVVEDQSIAPNNLALFDILLSMEFVKQEISNFGGNSQKVTLLGHSYGGSIAAQMHFSTEINQDLSLFQKTASISSFHYFDTLERQIEKTKRFAGYANCTPPEFLENHQISRKFKKNQGDLYMMKCLQGKSAIELLRIQRLMEDLGLPQYKSTIQRAPLFQEISLTDFIKTPKRIPMLTGCTLRELDTRSDERNLVALIDYKNPKEVDEKYRMDRKMGNFDFQNHTDQTLSIFIQTKQRVQKLAENGIPVYLYEYTYPNHSLHTDDLFYLMGVHQFEMDENEIHLREVYRQMFTDFIKFGNPGFNQSNGDTYYEVFWNQTTRPHMESHFEQNALDYWFKDMVEYDKNITSSRQLSQRSLQLPHDLENNSQFLRFFSICLVSFIFLFGCIVGRFCFPKKKNYYIRLDGSDFHNDRREQLDKVF